ncbi:MAG: Sec-independent protein translocase subunit TatA/TatB [Nitrosopumilaceae archaeon]
MLDYWLNIMGSEWIIIIFVALIVLLGTNRLPEVTKKLGKVVGEYSKAKNDIQKQFKDFSDSNLNVLGPVQNEREKLDTIAKTIGIDSINKSDEELRELISGKIGKQNQETSSENNSKSLN